MERNGDVSNTNQGSRDIHPVNNVKNAQVPTNKHKPYKMVHDISSQIMKQSHHTSEYLKRGGPFENKKHP